MSETGTAGAPAAGGETGAVASAQPVAAQVAAPAAAPAAAPPPSAPVQAVETPTPASSSLLSEAAGAEPAPAPEPVAEPAGEPKAAAPAEPAAAAEPAQAEPAAPAAPPTYEPFKFPDGSKVDDQNVTAFTGMLGEFEAAAAADPSKAHALAQDLGQKIIDLYVAGERAAEERRVQAYNDLREQWREEFRTDPTIGGNRQNTTLQRIGALVDRYAEAVGAQQATAVRDAFGLTGAGDHPAVLRFMAWTANHMTETSRMVTPMVPRKPVGRSPAQRMYPNTPNIANGAA